MTTVAESCAELATLIPRLPAALIRDSAGTRHGGGFEPLSLVNSDVEAVMEMLRTQVPARTREAAGYLHQPSRPLPVFTCLIILPSLIGRMHDLGMAAREHALTADVHHWRMKTKLALGFATPNRPLPGHYPCPWADVYPERHEDGWELYIAGDEAFLTHNPEGPSVTWVMDGAIRCPAALCAESWPYERWPRLGELLGVPVPRIPA